MVLRLSHWCVPIGVMFFLGRGGEGEGVTLASMLTDSKHCSPCFPGSSLQARCLTWLNSLPSALTLANWKRSSTSMRTNWHILSRNARKGIFSTDTTRSFHGRCFSHRFVLFKVSSCLQPCTTVNPRSPSLRKRWLSSKPRYQQSPEELLMRALYKLVSISPIKSTDAILGYRGVPVSGGDFWPASRP